MNHEIVGPEVTQVTGQLRIPKDIAISKHLAQFWSENMTDGAVYAAKMERKARTDSLVETLIALSEVLHIDVREIRDCLDEKIKQSREKVVQERRREDERNVHGF